MSEIRTALKLKADFYIVDDDRTVRKILGKIIADHDLGLVVGEAEDGAAAQKEIAALMPDIVLIDLLLPGVDGITLVTSLKNDCPKTSFVMLSQVADKDMVAKAYQSGVDFFINKPINIIEVVSVIGQVHERMSMRNIIQSLKVAIGGIDSQPSRDSGRPSEEVRRRQIKGTLAKLGILGENGSEDIVEMCLMMLGRTSGPETSRKMSDQYALLAKKYAEEQGLSINAASVEQRIRRAISKALNNTANLGLEDYGNEFFVAFSSSFFEFTEVRRQMNFIRGVSDTQGKISAKKFIEGLVMQVQNE
ncbi:histidine kinase [Deltaproteobacteria bacterium Smac51]|nr:histidine kinase [Deltaproteobacteria bacterium Smac51]